MNPIYINKNENGRLQYLSTLLPGGKIPSNVIVRKTVPGCGATYAEIKADRPSIIVEPNVPPIIGKTNDPKHKDDNIIPVYEGIYTEDIVKKLNANMHNPKILTTPEGFSKVKDAFEQLDIYMYSFVFLLMDECHQYIKDIDYRPDIILPIDDFFCFDQKALVSATPLQFSDPRFDEQNFEMLDIIPNFDYQQRIELYPTNNVLETLKRVFDKLGNTAKICVFVNSTDMTYSIIDQLNIKELSAVFCSKKSVDKLKSEYKFKYAYENWSYDRMKQYNFYTSRFQVALDMIMDEKPHVILLTEVYFAEYTMFDPNTDVIQAVGRFRNGVSSISHIANTNDNLPTRTPEETKEYIHECECVYNALYTFYDKATSKAAKQAFYAAWKSVPFNNWLTKEGDINYFAMDNYLHDETVKSYYHDIDRFLVAYANCPAFDQREHRGYFFKLGDYERLKRQNSLLSVKDKLKEIVRQLDLLGECTTESELQYKDDLRKADAFIVEAYDVLGKGVIEALNYNKIRIREAIILKKYERKTRGTEFIQLIKNSFRPGQKYTVKYVKEEIKRIYKLLDVPILKTITAETINEFFQTSPTTIQKSKAVYIIAPKI